MSNFVIVLVVLRALTCRPTADGCRNIQNLLTYLIKQTKD